MNYISLFLTYVLAVAPQEASSFSSSRIVGRGRIRSLTSSISTSTPYQKSRLSLSSSANGEDASSVSSDKKVEGRKKRVIIGYKAMIIAYLAVGLRSIAKVGLTQSILHMIGGYIVMPSGVSYIMSGAATHDRLGSDTYKRLNLALLEYGLIGLSIISLGKGGNKLLSVAYILSVINSLKGYAYGVLGWDKQSTDTTLLKDLTSGAKDTVKGFLSMPKNVKAAGYQVATYFTAFLKLEKLWEIVKFIQANSITAELSMSLARFNRLAFLTLMVYTLKDAADRDRLNGGTFIKLNYLCSVAMGIQCAFNSGGLTTPSGILSAVFSLFFAFNGVASYMKNQYA